MRNNAVSVRRKPPPAKRSSQTNCTRAPKRGDMPMWVSSRAQSDLSRESSSPRSGLKIRSSGWLDVSEASDGSGETPCEESRNILLPFGEVHVSDPRAWTGTASRKCRANTG